MGHAHKKLVAFVTLYMVVMSNYCSVVIVAKWEDKCHVIAEAQNLHKKDVTRNSLRVPRSVAKAITKRRNAFVHMTMSATTWV